MKFKIQKNIRYLPDVFAPEYPCDCCENFSKYVIEICAELTFCKSCLTEAIRAIDAAILEDEK